MNKINTFDPIWEQHYSQGSHLNRYPFDLVVSFVYRHYPRHKLRHAIRILEVGCGTGNNLWFMAREGFQVLGIDASVSAVKFAKHRFFEEGLRGDFQVGDFVLLPFYNEFFDLAIDRCSITCCGQSSAHRAVNEVNRVLQLGGKLLFNCYSKRHTSYGSGRPGPDGLRVDISAGTLVGVGQICFYDRDDLEALFNTGWKWLSIQHMENIEQVHSEYSVHAEWKVIVEKVS